MVTMPFPSATDPRPDKPRSAVPLPLSALLAAGWLLGAAIALAGIGLIGRHLGVSAYVWLTFLNAVVLLLAASGAMIPATRTAGLILAWNGLGVSLSLLAIGLFNVGALIAMPVILIALGLSAWPRATGEPLVNAPAIIALTGGCFFLPVAYALTWVLGWLAGLAG